MPTHHSPHTVRRPAKRGDGLPRGPRRVRRNPHERLRALARDVESAGEIIRSLSDSERRAWEQAGAARAAADELISMLSHDLRTPLQAIFGYAELLEQGVHGNLNERQLVDLARIRESQQSLLRVLNAVLRRVANERLASGAN